MVNPLREIPDWASDRHIGNGENHLCAHCLKQAGREVEVEVTDT